MLAAFEGDRPDPGAIEAITGLVEAGTVRIIDLLHVSKGEDGVICFAEIDEAGIQLGEIDLAAAGLASQEDVEHLGGGLPAGMSAVLLVVELLWAKRLATQVTRAGGFVVDSVPIPAPIVNAAIAEAVGA